ncbi:auxin-responsive protein SAUR32-like [Cynara cardunculus var. scolymus]|uniref:auxin-responsive protein SAUR32-like n=1 Tax=Cynara cardunculus var. scolymus TaxID=59895 RepID=UPI000D62A497|nr:auxin-responsive protein SAUR32-like [Cynara cardunculus var. scolymus]
MGSSSTSKLLVRLPQPHGRLSTRVPKGCLAVKVGEAGAEQQRFVVPVICFNHPLFMQLLKDTEDEYGFEQKGTITIPCNVHHFRTIINRIIHHHHHPHHGCFRVWAG